MPDFGNFGITDRIHRLEERIEREHSYISALTRQQNEDRRDVQMLRWMVIALAGSLAGLAFIVVIRLVQS